MQAIIPVEYFSCGSACADQNKINYIDLILKKAENPAPGNNDDDDTQGAIHVLKY